MGLDVFWGRTIPFHLATVESARRVAARLTPHGILLVNLISSIDGPRGELFRAEYATLRQVFPQILVFAVFDPSNGEKAQNIVLAALRSAAPVAEARMGEYVEHLWRRPIPNDVPPLTDDFAPVELYAARQLTPEELP